MPPPSPPQQSYHNWKNPGHYKRCPYCRNYRVRMIKYALEAAQRNAEAAARVAGRRSFSQHFVVTPSSTSLPVRKISVPGSSRTVTIQLPYSRDPVAPNQDVTPRPQKRTFDLFDEAVIDKIYNRAPLERSQYSWSSITQPNSNYQFDSHRNPFPLSRPQPPQSPEAPEAPAEPAPITDSIPGAWPSWADEQPTPNLTGVMTFTTKVGANIWGTVSSIFGATSSLCTVISQRFLQPSPQTYAPITHIDGPTTKRRRIDDDIVSEIGSRDNPIEIDDSMDIDEDVESDYPENNYATTSDEDDNEDPESQVRPEDISPRSGAVAAAAQRAVRFFPSKNRMTTSQQLATPPTSDDDEQSIPEPETTPEFVHKPLPPSQYKNIFDFFDNEDQHSLPGLERSRLLPNRFKIRELDSQRQEREEAREALRLRPLGLRRPRQFLITDLTPDWDQKARAAPLNGRIGVSKWKNQPHPDSVPLAPKDFGRMVPESAWLNDDAIHATLVCLATYINDAAGVTPQKNVPRCVAISSLYWSSFCQDESKIFPRPFNRKWGMNPDNFLDIDTVLIPVNLGNHWTLLVIRPNLRTVSYVDSFHSHGQTQLEYAFRWLKLFLGAKFRDSEWKIMHFQVPSQTNGYDCGMFVITNSIYLALGLDPNSYSQDDMPLQRRRIAAMLLNGGFTGPFDLSHL